MDKKLPVTGKQLLLNFVKQGITTERLNFLLARATCRDYLHVRRDRRNAAAERRRPRRLGYVRDVQPGRRAALEALPPELALLSGNMSVHAVHAIRGPRAYPEGDTSCGACVSRVPCSQPASKTGRQACVGASCVRQSGERRECGVRCARAGGERRATARTSSATATTVQTLVLFFDFSGRWLLLDDGSVMMNGQGVSLTSAQRAR